MRGWVGEADWTAVRNILTYRAMITSRLTTKAQTTVPQAVRVALGLTPGDELAYVIEQGRVVLTKAAHSAVDDPFAAFGEWDSPGDAAAYRGF